MTKQTYVSQIRPGDQIEDIFALASKNLSHKKDGNPYLTLTLADKSGQVKAMVWDQVDQLCEVANAGDFIKISAMAQEYRGQVQVIVKSMSLVPAESVCAADFLPSTSRDVDHMFERLESLTQTIKTEPLRALLNAFWQDPEFAGRFKKSPAAKKMHHAFVGGLLEHTLSMAVLANKIASHYSGVDRDVLLTGAVLHDIGKVRELSCDHTIDYTDEGRLLSHIIIGLELVDEKIKQLGDAFPSRLATIVKHLIVSHHGAREYGSPEPPKTIEAVLLNYIDEIDSRVNGIREFMATEDSSSSWTSYHRLLERQFFITPTG
ncbi:MAG: HD domain-containing protein [Desulfobacteraceae bacterium]|nr:HD domain-containing protein [Desulfobacteraceae bacterium]